MTPPPPTPPDATPSPSTPGAARGKRPLQICIASPEFIGITPHGGPGLAYTAMAQALAAAGHHVTCLFFGPIDLSSGEWQRWVEKYQADGLALVALPHIKASELVAPPHLIQSYETYHWLKKNDRFDIIHFPDQRGPGYHTLTAKRHGLAFACTTICIGLHSMAGWLKAAHREQAEMSVDEETEFVERQAVALADAVVSPSHYLLNWISDHSWQMPSQRYVQQGLLPRLAGAAPPPVAPALRHINELVYFGALDTRQGVTVFCDALDSIPRSIAVNIKSVTFLGREAMIDGAPARTYIQQRSQRWSFPYQITTGLDEPAMIDYLRQNSRLAVIPSILDNPACRVLECLDAGIAFLTSQVGGVSELIAPSDVCKVCFEPKPGALCILLCAALTHGLRPARAVLDASATQQAWVALHENSLARAHLPVQPPRPQPATGPASQATDPGDDAVRAAIRALSADLKDLDSLKALARIHLDAGLFEAAHDECRQVLERNAGDVEALQMDQEAIVQAARLLENLVDAPMARPAQASRGSNPFKAPAAQALA